MCQVADVFTNSTVGVFTKWVSTSDCAACSVMTDPKGMDGSPPGSSVHGIFYARRLGWVAMSSSRGSP